MKIEILGQTTWQIHWGGIGDTGAPGVDGKLTACRIGCVVFYVRENVKPMGSHFLISSGERLAWKRGQVSKRHQQVLELACHEAEWEQIAALVHETDGLHRPVLRNRRFTPQWARRVFEKEVST